MRHKLLEIRAAELKLGHVDGHAARLAFLNTVIKRYDEGDALFMYVVTKQLECWCDGYIDPRVFCAVCDAPCHRVRNMLITWDIDHREDDNEIRT